MAINKKIRDSLLKQLKAKGADTKLFISLIDDYLFYWSQETAMQKDVETNGRTYKAFSATGNEYDKENPSVKNALMYNKQKLSILKELELNTSNVVNDNDDGL